MARSVSERQRGNQTTSARPRTPVNETLLEGEGLAFDEVRRVEQEGEEEASLSPKQGKERVLSGEAKGTLALHRV